MDQEMQKSLDELLDQFFAEPEAEMVEKSMIVQEQPQRESADEALKDVPESEKDKKRKGRPKAISEIPEVSDEGKREGAFDSDISEEAKEEDVEEAKKQVKIGPIQKAISDEEYKEYQELKRQSAEIKKAQLMSEDLIKSEVAKVASDWKASNESLKKLVEEQSAVLKAMANKPKEAKAITNITAVDRLAKSQANRWTKQEVLDVAEGLVKSGELPIEAVTELSSMGGLFNPEQRGILEAALKRK